MPSLKLIGVSREIMEGALKCLNIAPNLLAKRSNAMWDILLATEEEARSLAGSILSTKIGDVANGKLWAPARLELRCMGVPLDILKDHLVTFLPNTNSLPRPHWPKVRRAFLLEMSLYKFL